MMSGSDLQGRWMPSSVTEEDVLKLRDARYLTGEILHRLPAQRHVTTDFPGIKFQKLAVVLTSPRITVS